MSIAALRTLLLVASVVQVVCMHAPAYAQQASKPPPSEATRTPLYAQTVIVNAETRADFVKALQGFAKKEGFSFFSRPTRPGGHLIVQMERADFLIIAINSSEVTNFSVLYYQVSAVAPPTSELGRLADSLRNAMPPSLSFQERTGQKPAGR